MRKYVIALYIRLSVEDIKTESLSIPNQRLILREKAMSLPEWDNGEVLEFVDNGHTGTNFERPAVQELLTMVQAGSIDCIIVKDLSRFGRNSIETGYFIERVFPLYHTRFISVSDDFDTVNFKGDTGGIDVAFKYLISECYSRDMSMKTKSAKYAKMRRGEYQSVICPYGYRKSADGRMEPDENVAGNVRLIFEWAAEGNTAAEITRKLYALHIPTPGEYRRDNGKDHYNVSRTHGVWSSSTVLRMLEDEDHRLVIVKIADDGRYGFQPRKVCGMEPPVSGYHLVSALRCGADDGGVENAHLHDAVDGLLHELVVRHLEGVVLEGTNL